MRLMMLLMIFGLVGCQDALFPDDAPRSPYARYSALRGGQVEKDVGSSNGVVPNLRERMLPLEAR